MKEYKETVINPESLGIKPPAPANAPPVNPNEQALDAIWRDAKRYQFLRDLPDKECGQPGQPCIALAGAVTPDGKSLALNGEDADAAVDAAIERKRRLESVRIYKIAEEPK